MNKKDNHCIHDLYEERSDYEEVKELVYSTDLGNSKSRLTEYLRVKGFDEETTQDIIYKITQYITEQYYTEAIKLALSTPQ